MKVAKPNGPDLAARLSTEHASSSYGGPVLVLGDSVTLEPADAMDEGFELTGLEPGDAMALIDGGFMLAFGVVATSSARLKFMLEALLFDCSVMRVGPEPGPYEVGRCPESALAAVVFLADHLAMQYAEEMAEDDEVGFTGEDWRKGVSMTFPDASEKLILEAAEALVAGECRGEPVK